MKPPFHDQQLKFKYLKKLTKLSRKNTTKVVESIEAGKLLGLDEAKSIYVEMLLKEDGFIRDLDNIPGAIEVTSKGYENLQYNAQLRRWFNFSTEKAKTFLSDILHENKSRILQATLLILGFELIEPFVREKLNEYWVKNIISRFHPTDIFDIIFIAVASILINQNFKKKLKSWNIFFIFLYIKYRFYSTNWDFWPIFKDHAWNKHYILYIDFLGIYYLVIIIFNAYKYIRRKYNFPKEDYTDGFFLADLSLSKLSKKIDQSVFDIDKIGLNRNKFARQITEIIEEVRPFQSFAIGISGPWGSGKTSLIDLIIQNLKKGKNVSKYKFVDFSPWFFNTSEMLITNFFSLLEENFRTNKSLASELKAYGKEIAMAEKSILKTEFSKLFFEKTKGLKERYETIIKEIQAEQKVLIISIDDLDRLDKKEIVDVFRLIRIIADFPNTFYLVGYDRGYINSAIEQELTKHNPEKYADKIFTMEFKIPELSHEVIKDRLRLSVKRQIDILGNKVGTIYLPELDACIEYPELDKFIKNERDIKKFTNNLMVRYLTIKEEVNFFNFFLLELIYYKDIKIFNKLYENRESIFEGYKQIIDKNDESGEIRFNDLLGFNLPTEVKNILEILFGRNSHLERYSIANDLYFLRYFSLTLLANDFTSDDFNAIFEQSTETLQTRLVDFNTMNSPLLAERLKAKFSATKITNKKDLIKTIDGLLFLYNEVFHSKNDGALLYGINRNNLREFIFDLINSSTDDISFLEERLLSQPRVTDFAAFSLLISSETVYLVEREGDPERRKAMFLSFRETQRKFLKLEIDKANGKINDRIINQFQRLRYFALFDKETLETREYTQWFFDQAIIRFKDFIQANLNEIIHYIKRVSTENGDFNLNLAQEVTNRILLYTDSNSAVFVTNGMEKLKDFYEGFDTYKTFPYSFIAQTPKDPDHPECNDHICHESFELKKGIFFKITIEPIDTPYWRFGFSLSRSTEFNPVITSRHIDNFPVIHLSKGHLDATGEGRDDVPPNLDLAVYSGSTQEYVERIISNYQNQKITLYFYRDLENFIHIKVHDGTSLHSAKLISLFPDYNYAQISAWSDRRKFNISTNIKVLFQINPALSF